MKRVKFRSIVKVKVMEFASPYPMKALASIEKTLSSLRSFSPLDHRMEITRHKQRIYINDSKSTNVNSAESALKSCPNEIIWLVGGQSKGESFQHLNQFSSKITLAVCFGESGTQIKQQLGKVPTAIATDLKGAIEIAVTYDNSTPILLSPGCASFDEFKNFEDRGSFFRKAIAHL